MKASELLPSYEMNNKLASDIEKDTGLEKCLVLNFGSEYGVSFARNLEVSDDKIIISAKPVDIRNFDMVEVDDALGVMLENTSKEVFINCSKGTFEVSGVKRSFHSGSEGFNFIELLSRDAE